MNKEENFPKLPKEYIKPEVQLTGEDGNSFYILGAVQRAIKQKGREKNMYDLYDEQANIFLKTATSGDRDKLLRAAMHWTKVQ